MVLFTLSDELGRIIREVSTFISRLVKFDLFLLKFRYVHANFRFENGYLERPIAN